MKMKITILMIIGCLLTSSIVSANTINIEKKEEKNLFSNEKNQLRNLLDKKDYFNAINRDDIQYSGNQLLTGFDGNIVHAYFNTWGEQYSGCSGYRSIINDGYLYQAVQVDLCISDEYIGIVKYNASDGSLCDFEVFYDIVGYCGKRVMVIIDNSLFINGHNYKTGHSFLVKYNISGDSIAFEESLTLPYPYVVHNICTDGYNIYICADNDSDYSLLLQKYNTDLEPVWSNPKTWNGPYEDSCADMTFYDGSIFVIGETFNGNYNSFVLKFDSNGNLLEEVININDNQCGVSIKGYNGKIYIASYVYSGFGLNVDSKLSAYDSDLVNLWSESYNNGIYNCAVDIVIVDDYIYMSGYVIGIDWWNWMSLYLKSFVLKVDINNGQKIWWKTVDAPGTKPGTYATRICADESYLYLSGTYRENWFTTEGTDDEAYILKCDFNGNPSPDHPNVPDISGPARGEINVEHNFSFVSTMNSYPTNLKYYIEWGDGNNNITNFYPSGQEVIVSHTWTQKGSYAIRAKAITTYGYESGWGMLELSMPLSQPTEQSMLLGAQVSSSPTSR